MTKIFIPKLFIKIDSDFMLAEDLLEFTLGKKLRIHDYERETVISQPEKGEERVKIRILASEGIDFSCPSPPKSYFSLVSSAVENSSKKITSFFESTPNLQKNTILLHLHGGGFVSMSSSSHQNYTRKWAKILQLPIFSVDYQLAPDSPYPQALDDVWQAYMFILTKISEISDLSPMKIIVTGDSAGGNLAIGLTMLAIKLGARIPDGLMLSYPCLVVTSNRFTPSFLNILSDPILTYEFLNVCMDSYYKDQKIHDGDKDPFLSPLYAPDKFLQRFPKTRILVGDDDPFHDDCLRFTKRLFENGIDVKATVCQGMPHGFLSYDAPQGLPQARKGVELAASLIKELL